MYIASIVANGIEDKSIQVSESKYLLKILQELNDVEIIWLRSYIDPTLAGDVEFREKHKNILTRAHAYSGASDSELKKSALQTSYKAHLERLGLIKSKIRFNNSTGLPEFDKFSGEPKTSYTETTRLGLILLRQIGLIE